jgi:tRNA pseudouridine32 synthase/23S rRNA pseudouridine746 synthase
VNIPIFFENEFLYVVDKPHGWLTTPARLMDDPRPVLGRELQSQVDRQIFPVHRLDFEVSGLTVFAKDAASHRVAQNWFEHAQVRKLYEAFTRQSPESEDWQEWKTNLVRGKKRSFAADYGKPSVTKARMIREDEGFYKWELVAVTGRPHQLRYELSHRGYPIVGDRLYGGIETNQKDWLALRAVELDLSSMATDLRLGLPEVCRAPSLELPSDLQLAPAPPSR